MKSRIMKWFPVAAFSGDEETRQKAQVLHTITVAGILLSGLMIPVLWFSPENRVGNVIVDAVLFISLLLLQFLLRRNKVELTARAIIVLTFLWVTIASIAQGTIRSPVTSLYILVVIMASQFFKLRGIVVSTIASSLAILGLILAETAGLLPQPESTVTLTNWITYTIAILLTGFLAFYNTELTRNSLQRAEKEISERKAIEMELKILSRAVEQSPESIVITNLDGSIEYVNPSFTRVTGYTLEEAIGQNPRILKTDRTPEGTHVRLWDTVTAGKEWRGEFINRKKDGAFYTESAIISPITNPEGITTHYLAIKEDITERKRVEEALRETTESYRLLSENISDVIWILDMTTGKFRYVSPSVERLRGFSVEEVLTQTMLEAVVPDSLNSLMEKMPSRMKLFEQGQKISYIDELAQPCKEGSIVWTETKSIFQINETNGHLEVYGVSREINDRKRNQDLLQARLNLLELSAGRTLDEFLGTALDKIADFTGSVIAFFHFVEPDQKTLCLQAWSTRTLREFCKAEGKGMHYGIDTAGVWVDCVRQRMPIIHNDYASLPNRNGLPPGHAAVLRELVVPVYRNDRVVAILGVGNKPLDYNDKDVEGVSYLADVVWEIGLHKEAEQNLNEAHSRLNLLSQNLEDAGLIVYTRDADDKLHFEYLSSSMEALTGVKVEDAMRDSEALTSNILPEYRVQIREKLKESAQSLEQFRMEIQQRHAVTKQVRWLLLTFTPRKRPNGSTVWYGFQMDVTDRKRNEQAIEKANEQLRLDMDKIEQLQAELREQTLRDPLTGLYNRRYMSETISREMARSDREKSPVSFIMADIDHFKTINDLHGHQTGDRFLVEIAGLLKDNARSSDIVCRYGGEEFLLMLPGATTDDAARRAEELRQKIANLLVRQNGNDLKVTMSLGVSTFPEHGCDATDVIGKSDKALYLSKAAGRNRVTVWHSS
ncbi:MAG: diguanylate cyclase [Anaerolineaceae bacterium]